MSHRQIFEIVAVVLLCCFGVLLYADLQSIHQIYPIPDVMINSAPDTQTRQRHLDTRDRRNREERAHKTEVEVALAIDVLLLLCVLASLLRRRSPGLTNKSQGA